jgi:hypothetical protein
MLAKFLWPLLSVVALFIGLAIGFVLGDRPEPPPNATAVPLATTFAAPKIEALANPPEAIDEDAGRSQPSLSSALSEPNEMRRAHDLFEVVSRMEAREITAALSQIQNVPPYHRDTILQSLVTRWAEIDPAAAAAYAIGLRDEQARSIASNAALSAWAASDPNAVLGWAQNLPAGPGRTLAITCSVSVLARRDPVLTLQLVERLPRDQFTNSAYMIIFSEMASANPITTAARAAALQGPFREMAMLGTVRRWAESDPRAALAWARSIPEAANRDKAMETAFFTWAYFDPQSAAQEILSLPAGEPRNRALGVTLDALAAHGTSGSRFPGELLRCCQQIGDANPSGRHGVPSLPVKDARPLCGRKLAPLSWRKIS